MLSVFDCFDCVQHSCKISLEPFLSSSSIRLHLMDTGVHKNLMNILIFERKAIAIFLLNGKLRILQLVTHACSLRVAIDTSLCRLVQSMAIWNKAHRLYVGVQGSLANLQQALMSFIGHTENVDQLIAVCLIKSFHHLLSFNSDTKGTLFLKFVQSKILQYIPLCWKMSPFEHPGHGTVLLSLVPNKFN